MFEIRGFSKKSNLSTDSKSITCVRRSP